MKAVLQRAARAKVTVNGEATGEIGAGLAVLLGVQHGDTLNDVNYILLTIYAQKSNGCAYFRMKTEL